MHRIDTPTAQKDKFGAGKNGFTRGNPQTGTPATDLDDDYFDAIQEELLGVIEASGAAPDKSKRNQLLVAMKTLLLSRAHPFADIKADGAATVNEALSNLGFTFGTNWIKFPDGKIIQTGFTSGNSAYTISLPIPFTTTNYDVVITCSGAAAAPDTGRAFPEWIAIDNGSFSVVCLSYTGSRQPRAISWIAMGK
ncbi:gp53-like domain-containing protein [Kluyvera cryocrescens]|uniref:gp53-like domain-containing protein n=1 Tax=Kluyvera cryocrescens TaxID=580 RepID=UPI00398B125B